MSENWLAGRKTKFGGGGNGVGDLTISEICMRLDDCDRTEIGDAIRGGGICGCQFAFSIEAVLLVGGAADGANSVGEADNMGASIFAA